MCKRDENGARTCDSYGCAEPAVAWVHAQELDVDRYKATWVDVEMDLCARDLAMLEQDVDRGEAYIYEQIDYTTGATYHDDLTLSR